MDKRKQVKTNWKERRRPDAHADDEPRLSARGTAEEGRTNMGRNARSRTEKYGQ